MNFKFVGGQNLEGMAPEHGLPANQDLSTVQKTLGASRQQEHGGHGRLS